MIAFLLFDSYVTFLDSYLITQREGCEQIVPHNGHAVARGDNRLRQKVMIKWYLVVIRWQ